MDIMQVTETISLSVDTNRKIQDRDYLFFTLILFALAIDTLTPYLIWQGVIPETVRWLSHVAIALMIITVYARIMGFDRIPGLLWLIVGISLISGAIAISNGQGPTATLWGWWIMFQYPFVGLFAYLQPSWPKDIPRLLRYLLVGILMLVVAVQGIQYLLGEAPGDSLAGLFGEHGTGKLGIFIVLAFCFALGEWIVTGKRRLLMIVVILGGISSLLGEIKLFPFAAIGIAAISIVLIRGKQILRWALNSIIILGVVALFVVLYNAFVPAAVNRPLEKFLEAETLNQYFGFVSQESTGDRSSYSNVGRSFALQYVWSDISEDTKSFVLGLGLGARRESKTLGIAGIGFLSAELDLTSGTTLLVFIQEFGLLGIISIGVFFLWLDLRLFKDIREDPNSELNVLRYGLLLFSIPWPLWLWYGSVWSFRVPMLIYWVILGFVLSYSDGGGQPVTSLQTINEFGERLKKGMKTKSIGVNTVGTVDWRKP